MDFARKELEKYGWKEGEGLGKTSSGISKPIKAKLKFNNSGLGHKISDELVNPWWQRVYDSAAKNVEVSESKESVEVNSKDKDFKITTKKKKHRGIPACNGYGDFIKLASLTWKGEENVGVNTNDVDDEEERYNTKVTSGICEMTEEELFDVCGGRTAHKGARHGLSMSAKLARLEEQELGNIRENKKKRRNKTHNEEHLVCNDEKSVIFPHKKKAKKEKKADVNEGDVLLHGNSEEFVLPTSSARSKKGKMKKVSSTYVVSSDGQVAKEESVNIDGANSVELSEPSNQNSNGNLEVNRETAFKVMKKKKHTIVL